MYEQNLLLNFCLTISTLVKLETLSLPPAFIFVYMTLVTAINWQTCAKRYQGTLHESVGTGNSPEMQMPKVHILYLSFFTMRSLMTANHFSPAFMVHAITKLESQPKNPMFLLFIFPSIFSTRLGVFNFVLQL